MIDELMKELERLRNAAEILGRVWAEVDVYSGQWQFTKDGRMSEGLLKDLRDHFKFNDSE